MDIAEDVRELAVELAVDHRCIRYFEPQHAHAIARCRVAGRGAARQLGLRARTIEVTSAVTGRVAVIVIAVDGRDGDPRVSERTEGLIREAFQADG